MNRIFNNKIIVETGAFGNLGKSMSIRLAKAGDKIAASHYDQEALNQLDESLRQQGIETLPIICDITNKEACFEAATKIKSHWGRIDCLVNNTGITHIQRYTEMPKEKEITHRVIDVITNGFV